MVTRHDMEKQATQDRIEGHLEEISQSLEQLALVATEHGVHEGFLTREGESNRPGEGEG